MGEQAGDTINGLFDTCGVGPVVRLGVELFSGFPSQTARLLLFSSQF